MKNKKLLLLLLLLLLLYIAIIAIAQKDGLWSDEKRYIEYATNLTKGDYLPHYKDYLWSGPGYPVILLPFIFLKVPFLFIRLTNSLILLAAVYYFYLTLRLYISDRHALLFTCLYGIYPPFMRYIHLISTEIVAIFLVTGFLYYFCRRFRSEEHKARNIIISSGFLAYLALTKIFFGYVIISALLLSLSLYAVKRRAVFKKFAAINLLALLLCMPYLIYSYSVSGKLLYWGNSGGLSLYWMATPYENELGDWIDGRQVKKNPRLLANHGKTFSSIENLSYTEKDEILKKKAIQNIIQNPKKFLNNWTANMGRLLFNYPYSYTEQKLSTFFFMIPNMFIVVFFIICIYPSYIGRKLIPLEMYGILVFGLVSLGGSSLLSAYNRQFWPLVPVFTLWIAIVISKCLKVEIKR